MANFEVSVKGLPKWKHKLTRLRTELSAAAGAMAAVIAADNCDRIRRSIDLDGNAQQQNAPKTQARKQSKMGHSVPLRGGGKQMVADGDVLANPALWLVNGKLIGAAALNANITPAGGSFINVKTGFTVEPPRARQQIVGYLRLKGYRPPVGVSTKARKRSRELFNMAIRRAMRAN